MIVHFVGFGRMYDHHFLNFHKSNFLHEIVDIIRQFMSLMYILMDMITVLDIFAFFQTNENHIQLNEKKILDNNNNKIYRSMALRTSLLYFLFVVYNL